VAAIAQQFSVATKGTVEAVRARLIATAKRENAKVMATDPRPLDYTRWVDGSKGAVEETATSNSIIVYEYNRVNEVAQFALQYLSEISPDKSGRFKSSWQVLLNGQPVSQVTQFLSGDEILIVNDQPYARKIVSGHMKLSVPHNLTEHAQREVNSRFGNTVKASTTFLPLSGGYVLKGHFSKGVRAHARVRLQKDTQAGAAMTYPALRIVGRE
jgi:hypothetical protein